MHQEHRKIQVDLTLEVSSVWAIPYDYQAKGGTGIILAQSVMEGRWLGTVEG